MLTMVYAWLAGMGIGMVLAWLRYGFDLEATVSTLLKTLVPLAVFLAFGLLLGCSAPVGKDAIAVCQELCAQNGGLLAVEEPLWKWDVPCRCGNGAEFPYKGRR